MAAVSRSGRVIKPSSKRRATVTELDETMTISGKKRVNKKKKAAGRRSNSPSPTVDHLSVPPLADDLSSAPSSPSAHPSPPQSDVIDLEETASNPNAAPEDDEAKLGQDHSCKCKYQLICIVERLRRDWRSPIYAFYEPLPEIGYEKKRPYHEFICAKKGCGKRIRRYLDKGDAGSTGNLGKHVRHCWKNNVVQSALEAENLDDAREIVAGHRDGVLTSHFERIGKGKATYSSTPPTKSETR